MAIKDLLLKLRLQGAKKTKDDLKGVDSLIGKIGKTAVKVGASFFAARGLITGFKKMIDLSGQFQKVEQGFDNLARAQGFSAQTLDKLTKATDGTISSLDLMQQANNAMLLGIFDSEEQMANMFDAAQRLSSALGQTTTFGIESLVTGLGRQSKLMLDNLGIMIDVEKANKDYARALGISTRQLTDQQRKQAFVNAAMFSANTLVSQLGEEQLTLADNILQMKVAIDESLIVLGETFIPMITKVAKGVTFLAEKFKGLVDIVKKLSPEKENGEPPLQNFAKNAEEVSQKLKFTADEAKKLAQFTAQMSTSLATSAIMGDNVAEAFKRALAQQILITAQLRIQKQLQEAISAIEVVAGGPAGFLIKGLKFLFGASPTQAAPSPNITINQTIQGGMIDHNFAANSIIPAINKAISTGQARINR